MAMITLSEHDLDRLLWIIRNGTRSLKEYEPRGAQIDIHDERAREKFIRLLDKHLAEKERNNANHI